ncbi:peptide methionine sulfoxide reductase, partial [Mycena epipterygia]
ATPSTARPPPSIAIFASGCFWGTEHIFVKHFPPATSIFAFGYFSAEHNFLTHSSPTSGIPKPVASGVLKTSVGYTGGLPSFTDPDYGSVCSGATGHAEALRIEFDETLVGYAELVEFFYRSHDPTTVDRQGGDSGTQYRSAIFTTTPEQAEIAHRVTEEVQAKHFTPKGTTIVTQITEAGPWWDAETYHQMYLFKHANGYQCPTHRMHW